VYILAFKNIWAWLGLVALFTVLFELVLGWMATGNRIEVLLLLHSLFRSLRLELADLLRECASRVCGNNCGLVDFILWLRVEG